MLNPNSLRGLLGRSIILGWGLGSLLLNVNHFMGESGIKEAVIGYTFPLLVASAVVTLGVYFLHQGLSNRKFWRLGVWSAGGIFAMSLFETSRVLYQAFETEGMSEPYFALLHAGTAGALIGIFMGLYDLRTRDREQQLRREREWADRLQQSLLVLQRVLRHDIRTTVNVISMNVEEFRDDDVPDEHITQILDRVSDLEAMAEKGRRIESIAEREDYDLERVPLINELTSEVQELESKYPEATISVSGPDEVDVYALPEIRGALHEVIENAIVHNRQGTPAVDIDVQQAHGTSSDESVLVTVQDNGSGIPEHEIDVIEAGEETQLKHSSGIGLWTVKWITEKSNGDVHFESGSGNGSIVTLRLSPC